MKNIAEKNKFKKHSNGTSKNKKIESSDYGNDDFNGSETRLEPTKKWYEELKNESEVSGEETKFQLLEKLRVEAKSILDGASILYNSKPPKSISPTDYSWIKKILVKGTKSDKIASYTLLIQDSPIHNLNLLNTMIGMVKVGKKEWTLAAETLQELFLNDLLPPHRKLLLFSQRPLNDIEKISENNDDARKKILQYWFFENQLKLAYRDFIVALNQIAHDSVDANKEKVVSVMFKLLESNPEQESALLSNIVNKLGDPSHKVGSKVIYTLVKLLETHPNMKHVVVDEIEKLLFRPNIGKRAQYYSICFLAQFCLSSEDSKLAKKLISIYLSIFKACIKLGDIDSRMMSALLAGVNRAYPFTKEDLGMLQEQINTIYKIVHLGKPSVSIQALSLLYLMSGQKSVSERFYMVLYKKISELKLYNSTHHAMFLSLIYKAVNEDVSCVRVSAFVKRLLQVSAYMPAALCCGILIIVSEVLVKKDKVLQLEHEGEVKIESEPVIDEDDDGYEYYEDVPLESEVLESIPVKKEPEIIDEKIVNFVKLEEVKSEKEVERVWRNPDIAPEDRITEVLRYDPFARNPLFSGSDKTIHVELLRLTRHYHPSVCLFAQKILTGERIRYSGDPLQDFALIRFLDKFSFKNPKNLKSEEEEEEKETFRKFGKRKLYSKATVGRLKFNSVEYLQQNETKIPVDEKFIYNYLKKKASVTDRKPDEEDSDVDSVGSDEFEEMLNSMSGTKNDDDIDFLQEAGELPKKTADSKGKRQKNVDEETEEPEFEESDVEDDESNAEDFEGDEMDSFSDELLEGSELDESEIPPELQSLNLPKKKKKSDAKGFSKNNLFASAEEYSELLEQTDLLAGGSQAVSNEDNAGMKQLKWESHRDRGFKGKSRRNFKGKKREAAHQKANRGIKKKRRF